MPSNSTVSLKHLPRGSCRDWVVFVVHAQPGPPAGQPCPQTFQTHHRNSRARPVASIPQARANRAPHAKERSQPLPARSCPRPQAVPSRPERVRASKTNKPSTTTIEAARADALTSLRPTRIEIRPKQNRRAAQLPGSRDQPQGWARPSIHVSPPAFVPPIPPAPAAPGSPSARTVMWVGVHPDIGSAPASGKHARRLLHIRHVPAVESLLRKLLKPLSVVHLKLHPFGTNTLGSAAGFSSTQ